MYLLLEVHINIRNNILIKAKVHNHLLADSNLCFHVSKADTLAAGPPNELFAIMKNVLIFLFFFLGVLTSLKGSYINVIIYYLFWFITV